MLQQEHVTVDSINLYYLDENQKESLQEYAKYTESMTDDRLNDLYHPVYLIDLPNRWGHSFDLMKIDLRKLKLILRFLIRLHLLIMNQRL